MNRKKCVWCYVPLDKKNKSKEWCDPCCVNCAKDLEETKDREAYDEWFKNKRLKNGGVKV